MSGTGAAPAFARLPDLASRALSGAVVAANDEFFAEKENLVLPDPPAAVADFGHKGKVYDGWETRRRRTPGHDWAIVRLGVPGVVHGVVVDTSWFTGNFPSAASLEGAAVEGHPSAADWSRPTGCRCCRRSTCREVRPTRSRSSRRRG